ncbi:MAG: RlmE family RNA methyltransferase [Nanoarchaeota archaeon]
MSFLQDKKSDFYYKQAKEKNYRARSAFKLLEIQKKFNLIKAGDKVLDLGASPGGWSQVALEFIDGGKVIGVDKKILSKLNGNFKFVFGDFTEEKTLNEIKEHLSGKADVILCDASPEFSGIKSMDIGLSLELNKVALEIAKDLLKIKGKFICKTFRGLGFQEFVKDVKKNFASVSMFKPKSSKSDSAEIYLIAIGFRKE